jgi:CHAT domain-containing protein
VDYFVGFRHIHAAVTSRNHPLRYYSFVRSPETEEWIGSMLTSPAAAGRLYDALLTPILIDLPAEINRLQFIPDDVLWQVPFAVLMNGEEFLAEDYAVSTAYSTKRTPQG